MSWHARHIKANLGQRILGTCFHSGKVSYKYREDCNPLFDANGWGVTFISYIGIMVCVYFASGILHNYVLQKRRGVEMIPNRLFWVSLPALVNDGIWWFHSRVMGQATPSSDKSDKEIAGIMAEENSWDDEAAHRRIKKDRKREKEQERERRKSEAKQKHAKKASKRRASAPIESREASAPQPMHGGGSVAPAFEQPGKSLAAPRQSCSELFSMAPKPMPGS
jgi:hypothetical protein